MVVAVKDVHHNQLICRKHYQILEKKNENYVEFQATISKLLQFSKLFRLIKIFMLFFPMKAVRQHTPCACEFRCYKRRAADIVNCNVYLPQFTFHFRQKLFRNKSNAINRLLVGTLFIWYRFIDAFIHNVHVNNFDRLQTCSFGCVVTFVSFFYFFFHFRKYYTLYIAVMLTIEFFNFTFFSLWMPMHTCPPFQGQFRKFSSCDPCKFYKSFFFNWSKSGGKFYEKDGFLSLKIK